MNIPYEIGQPETRHLLGKDLIVTPFITPCPRAVSPVKIGSYACLCCEFFRGHDRENHTVDCAFAGVRREPELNLK